MHVSTVCTPHRLPPTLDMMARRLAVEFNPANAKTTDKDTTVSTAVVTISKRWAPGTTVTVAFLDGVPEQHARVQPYFHEWTQYANLKFIFILNKWNADVRVSFREGEGSWSTVGIDSLVVPREEPSMVLGWIAPTTSEREVRRVTLHEVGHVLGFEHELESPAQGGPDYDEEKIIAHYAGPPYHWDAAETRRQVLDRLSPEGRSFTKFDPHSIMCYTVPDEWVKTGRGTPLNWVLSDDDKKMAREMYPK